jgi:chromosome segregation ATPase
MMRSPLPLLALVAVVLAPLSARAADNDVEQRLREALRRAITQARSLEDERATLQAKQAESEKQIEALRQQVDALTKQAATQAAGSGKQEVDRAALEQATAEFNRRLAEANDAITRQNETLEKWKAAYNEAATVARTKEAERAQLAQAAAQLTERPELCSTRNAELFKVGSEILDRYAGVGFGDVLTKREPFLGLKRVELENLVQDYRDKLLDQKVSR